MTNSRDRNSPGVAVFAVVLTAVLVLGARPGLAGLSASQQAALRTATAAVQSAEGDLRAAAGSAGTAANPAKGSRLKLTRMRLDSAIGRLNQAAGLLGELPGDDAAVQALLERHRAAAASAGKIQSILSPGSGQTPAGSGRTTPAPTAGTSAKRPATGSPAPKLDYRAEKKLKDARWYLREVAKYTAPAMAVVKRLDGEGEKAVHADVRVALASIETGWAKQKLVEEYLAGLPADHPEVRAAAEQSASGRATLGGLQSRLEAANVAMEKLTGMRHYPRFDEDFRRMVDFSRRYGDFQMTLQQPEKLISIVREDGEVVKEVKRVARLYLPLVEQKTNPGLKLERLVNHLLEARRAFGREVAAYGAKLPVLIDADLAEADRIADLGVAEKKPLYFGKGSGIEQTLGFAEVKVGILETLDAGQGAAYRRKLDATRAGTEKRAESLRVEIIRNNSLPEDRYQGGERKAHVGTAAEAWKKLESGAKVLGARIPSADWKRVTEWRWGTDSFYKVDYSWIQVQLLVEYDGKLAVIRPVNLYRNHLQGDQIKASPLYQPGDDPSPQNLLLKEKIR